MSANMELMVRPPPRTKSLQTRESFAAVEDSFLGKVQVADEAGFAYLVGDINFGAIGAEEIHQNIRFIVLTTYFSCPLDREFGLDYSLLDKPMAIAEAVFSQEVAMRITLYEPRAQFRSIDFTRDELVGKLSPNIKVVLLTTEELPSTVPAGTSAAAVAGPPGVVIEEVDLPGFYESIIEMARVPGPPGPVGPKGIAATIEIGMTTTGAPGTPAEVVNIGDSSAAIFDFTIPKGDKGDQGTGVNIKGTVPTSGDLPTTGNQPGDMWIAADTGHGWTWDGDSWVDVGPIQGPVGPQGPIGAQGPQGIQGVEGPPGSQGNTGGQGPQGNTGPQGATGPANVLTVSGTTTGAPGTNASVAIAGTSPAQSLAFTIPRGNVGAQGTQGTQGIQGPTGMPATATAGTTATGAPGTNASVVNVGTTSAAVFNFTIPRGDVGAQGPQGIQGPAGVALLPRNYLAGLTVGNNATDAANDIDIAVGECIDSGNAENINLTTSLTKRLDATWVAGTNQGGRQIGSTLAVGTWHVFAIKNESSSAVDVMFSASLTPVLPSGFTLYRRIASLVYKTGTIQQFRQLGDYFQLLTSTVDVNDGLLTTGQSFDQPLSSVPAGFKVWADMSVSGYHSAGVMILLVGDPEVFANDAVALTTTAALTTMSTYGLVWTNTARAIRTKAGYQSVNGLYHVTIVINGYWDYRNKT